MEISQSKDMGKVCYIYLWIYVMKDLWASVCLCVCLCLSWSTDWEVPQPHGVDTHVDTHTHAHAWQIQENCGLNCLIQKLFLFLTLSWSEEKGVKTQVNAHSENISQTVPLPSSVQRSASTLWQGLAQLFPLWLFKTQPGYFLVLTPVWLSDHSFMWRETTEE